VANGVCPFGTTRVTEAVGVKREADAVGVKRANEAAEAVGVKRWAEAEGDNTALAEDDGDNKRLSVDVGARRIACVAVLTAKGEDTGEDGIGPLHITEVTSAFCKNPCGTCKSAGAVKFGGACWQSFMFEGVRPDGTSIKVFLTGSGTPLFVAPRSTAPGTCPRCVRVSGATGGLRSSSDSGTGLFPGGMPACCRRH